MPTYGLGTIQHSNMARDPQNEGPETREVDINVEGLDILSDAAPDMASLAEDLKRLSHNEVIRAILDQGVDVKQSSREIEMRMVDAEMLSVKDYVEEAGALEDLQKRIEGCDGILSGIETLLQQFQVDLGNMGGQVKTLQEQSASLSMKLNNRKQAGKLLSTVLESLVIPPSLVQTITRADVDEAYHEFLAQLSSKLDFLSSQHLPPSAAARRDVQPELDRLRHAALGRVRAFLLKEFQELSQIRSNVALLQNTRLLPLKHLMKFVMDYGPEVREEVKAGYVSIRARGMQRDVTQLLTTLDKIRAPPAGKGDLLGGSGSGVGGVGGLGSLFGPKTDSHKASVFRAGTRLLELRRQEQTPLVPFVEIKSARQHPVELLFRSALSLVSDACTSEFLFCLEFFGDSSDVFDAASREAVAAAERWVQGLVADSHDLVGLLLMVRANWLQHLVMQRRAVPCLDAFFDRINLLLWPRIKSVLSDQLASIGPAKDAALVQKGVMAHPVTRRSGELMASLYQLCTDVSGVDAGHMAGEGQMKMAARQVETMFMDFLERQERRMVAEDAAIFRVNNFDIIVNTLREVASDRDNLGFGAAGNQALQRFEGMLDASVTSLGLMQLRKHFTALLGFVEAHVPSVAAEALGGSGGGEGTAAGDAGGLQKEVSVQQAEKLARSFEATWERQVENMRGHLLRSVGNMLAGQSALRVAVTRLVVVYRAFVGAVAGAGPTGQEVAGRAVKVATLMYEIKRITKLTV